MRYTADAKYAAPSIRINHFDSRNILDFTPSVHFTDDAVKRFSRF